MSQGLGRHGHWRGRGWGRGRWGGGPWWGGGYYAPTYAITDCASICALQNPGNPYAQLACQRNCAYSPGYYLAGLGAGEDHTLRNSLIAGAVGVAAGYFLHRALKK